MSEVKYKDSGIEWIGQIPEDWKLKKLRECITTKSGKFIEYRYWTNGKYDVIGANGKVGTYDSYNIDENCILMGRVGTTGNPRLSTGKSWITDNCLIIRTFEDVDMHWVLYLLSSLDYDGIITKTAQPLLSATKLTSKKVPYPPLPEQIKIANYLDRVISNLDRQIEINEQLSCKYKELKKSEIYECVTKGLPESRARRGYKDSGIEWIGEIPNDWGIDKGKYRLERIKRKIRPNDEIITCFRDGEVTLRKNRREVGYTFSKTESGYQGIDKGDLIIHGMDGFAGAIGISDSTGKGSPVLININTDQYKRYMMYYFRYLSIIDFYKSVETGIRVRSCDLNFSKIKEFILILPPFPEQIKIADYLDKKCTIYDSLTNLYQAKADKLKELKKSMIYEYVTGKKRVK